MGEHESRVKIQNMPCEGTWEIQYGKTVAICQVPGENLGDPLWDKLGNPLWENMEAEQRFSVCKNMGDLL